MKIGVFGSGALGSLFAARLAPVADVVLIGTWAEQLTAVAQRGLLLTLPDGREILSWPTALQPAAAPPIDLALVLVKSYQTARTAAHVAALLRPGGSAITLQNGLGNVALLAARLGPERVVPGTTALGAVMTGPGAVRQVGTEPVILPVEGPAGVTALARSLQAAGFGVARHGDVSQLIWQKLTVNAAINPPTALFDVDNGVPAAGPAGRLLLTTAARETARVAVAAGVALEEDAAAARAVAVAQATATNRSSMRQDLARGGPTEIEAICGAIVAHADAQRLDAPLCRLYQALVTRASLHGRAAALRELQHRAATEPMAKLLYEFQSVLEQRAPCT